MSLYAFNKTTAPLPLAAGNPVVTLPLSPSAGARGPRFDVTDELNALSGAAYTALEAQRNTGAVDFLWTGHPEYLTGALNILSEADQVSLEPNFAYAGPSGLDTNPYGTPTSKWATISRCLAAMPVGKRSENKFFLDAGNLANETNLNPFISCLPTSGPGNKGTPLAIIGTPTLAVAGTETGGGSLFLLTDGSGPFGAVDSLRGKAVLIVTSSNPALVGARKKIRRNTASTITIARTFGAVVPVGTTFIIEDAGTIVNWAAGGYIFGAQTQMLGMRDLTFKVPANGIFQLTEWGQFLTENVVVDISAAGAAFAFNRYSVLRAQSQPGPWTNDGANDPFSALRGDCGIYVKGAAGGRNFTMNEYSAIENVIITDDVLAAATVGSVITPTDWSSLRTTFDLDRGCQFGINGQAANPPEMDGQVVANAAKGVLNANRAASFSLDNVVIKNSGGHGILAKEGSIGRVGAGVAGTGNGLAILSGAAASLIAGAGAGQVRLSGVAGLTAAYVGDQVVISGAATGGNNMIADIAAFVSATVVDLLVRAGFPTQPDANNGALAWATLGGAGIRVKQLAEVNLSTAAGAVQATITGSAAGKDVRVDDKATETYAAVFTVAGSAGAGTVKSQVGIL